MRVQWAFVIGGTVVVLLMGVAIFGLTDIGRSGSSASNKPAKPAATPPASPTAGASAASSPPPKLWPKTGPDDPTANAARAAAGVPPGLRLRPSGPLTVRKKGAVIEGLQVQTEINVDADNVTIRNVHLIGAGEWGVIQRKGRSGLRVEHVEINGDGRQKLQFGILNQGGMLTVGRTRIHTVSDGIGTDHGVVEDSVISRLKEFPGDHCVAIASNGPPSPGLSLVIRRNELLNQLSQTSALSIYQDFGPARDVTVEGNILAGGGYTLYGGKGKFAPSANIRIINNVFSRRYFRQGGSFGPVTAFEKGRGNVWQGNRWENGAPVRP